MGLPGGKEYAFLKKRLGDPIPHDGIVAWGLLRGLAEMGGLKSSLRQKIFREKCEDRELKRRKAKADESYIKIEKEIKEREKVIKELETNQRLQKRQSN